MRYHLEPITQNNWRKITQLAVAPSQRELIEDNTESLLEAAYDSSYDWTPIALCVDNRTVGFAMIGAEDKQNKTILFDRFMIDQNEQKQGYGHALFQAVLTYLEDRFKLDHIYIRVHQKNEQAIPFYESFRFALTGEKDPKTGKKLMWREVRS
ncbi:spermidine acetyltransferase [Tetragenococcus osmophilus]|uniref:Spermidine acetyltransferase n=1 Tax=Tetragenococcus osmophilus TaxID=526944 RepID=A0AA38CYD0_9ENTE|nr:GNAT family N-acetyltransferase [Tetragenococcus osmophilus]AYW48036.1 spermidine acetyltransferase [Tetragenococcus osmophilus]GMA53766.1 spermidine acetyltransferase [Alicyclobacillus contaminans]GMA72309.1 spermidine acetyltransferase [Tetragenococcus osmophilus]